MKFKREISKLNYKIHIDAIKENLFGKTEKQRKDGNPTVKRNMLDVVTLNQLLVLANLESYNAVLLAQGTKQKKRRKLLRQLVVQNSISYICIWKRHKKRSEF